MRVVESLLNRSEEVAYRELEKIASDNSMRVFVKLRLSDVIDKQATRLTQREFDFYTRSHLDFVLSDSDPSWPWNSTVHMMPPVWCRVSAIGSRTSFVDRQDWDCFASTTSM